MDGKSSRTGRPSRSSLLLLTAVVLMAAVGFVFSDAGNAPDSEGATASGYCGDNLYWSIDSEGNLTIEGSGPMYDNMNYASWYEAKSVKIGDSVTSIGGSSFWNCTSLTSVTIPDSVITIGDSAFQGCTSLETVVIGDSVESIGEWAFYGCTSLSSVEFGDSVASIEPYVFSDCTSLASVTIPSSVESIGEWTFWNCTSLAGITIGDSVESIESGTFSGCTSLVSVTIPASVTSIGEGAFDGCTSLASVTIPSSVTSIAMGAFARCTSLTSVTIPSSVTSIGNGAFLGCSSMKGFEVDSNNTSYICADGVIYSKDRTELVQYPAGRTDPSFTIPSSVTSIAAYAFSLCATLESVTIGGSLESIGNMAFLGCTAMTDFAVDGSNTHFSSSGGVLYDKDRTELVQYPAGRSDSSFTVPSSVTSIGIYAFSLCAALESVTIGDSVESIGIGAFYGCSSLTSLVIPDSVTSIGNGSFSSCESLRSVTIGNSVAAIGGYAFEGCTSLDSVDIGESVTSIGWNAFYGCSSLESIDIPSSVTSIGSSAFEGCTSLTSVTIPDSVTSLENYVFSGCTSLGSVDIGESVASIGWRAFYSCSSLGSIVIPVSVTSIEDYAFGGCTSLLSVSIPDSVTDIGQWAFPDHVFYDSDGTTVLSQSAEDLAGCVFEGKSADSMVLKGYVSTEKHTVSYDVDGGSASAPDSGRYYEGQEFVLPGYTGTKTGYAFAGWSCDGTEYKVGQTVTMSSEDMEFVAIWVAGKNVSYIYMKERIIYLARGETHTLTAYVYPDDAAVKDVTWTTVDESVATVDADGVVTATGPGATYIVAHSVDGNKATTCTVWVESEDIIVMMKSTGDGDVRVAVASLDGGYVPAGKITMELNYSVYSKMLDDWADRSDSTKDDPVLVDTMEEFVIERVDLSGAEHPDKYTSAVAMFTVGEGADAKTYVSDVTAYSGKTS